MLYLSIKSFRYPSTPYIIEQNNEIIAHLGIIPFEMIINDKKYHAGALHAICTQEAHRRKGYFTQLMKEALHDVKQAYDFSFLFTDRPFLYEPFGFRVIPEHDFLLHNFIKKPSNIELKKCDTTDPHDLKMMESLYLNRLPLSNRLGIAKETTVSMLNALRLPIFYLTSENLLVVYEVKEDTLYLMDIVFNKPCSLSNILNAIPEPFSKIILQFCPDRFSEYTYSLIDVNPEDCLMISEGIDIGKGPIRYPLPQHC